MIVKDVSTLGRLMADGWHDASNFPDTNRLVQIAYDDGSTGQTAKGFVDEVSQIPPTGKRIWWEFRDGSYPHPFGAVLAWKEIEVEGRI